jgi:hypothetical protein
MRWLFKDDDIDLLTECKPCLGEINQNGSTLQMGLFFTNLCYIICWKREIDC